MFPTKWQRQNDRMGCTEISYVCQHLDFSIEFAIQNLDKFIQPISDLRGSSHYRLEAMKGLFRRLQICLRQDKESLSIMEV